MLSNDTVVSVRGLSKAYTIKHDDEKHTLASEALMSRLSRPFRRAEREEFWALQDLSFDVQRGDLVGVIGRNGAGKSTLLKVLSRITEPTCGEVEMQGRVGSLLEVGTGFHPELTGRENIYLNGAILGMTRREIEKQFTSIVEFAGVEKFLDTPVKRYSSGMYVRLAFAVAAHLNPEILIIDEVLAVGDAEFQKKCLGKMQDVAHSGRTVFFVSHSMAAIGNLCDRCVVLDRGRIAFSGPTKEAVAHYMVSYQAGQKSTDLDRRRPYWATPLMTSARLLNADGGFQTSFPLGSDITIEITYDTRGEINLRTPVMGVILSHSLLGTVGGVNTRMTAFEPETRGARCGALRCTLKRPPLLPGEYIIDVWLGDGPADLDTLTGALNLIIEPTDLYGTGRTPFAHLGVMFFDPVWRFDEEAGQ